MDASLDIVLIQRRTLRTLMAGLIPAGAAMSGAYAASAVLGEDLTGSAFLGGLVAASMTTGSALASLPLARLMADRGRRPGLLVGYLTGILGALLAVLAALTGWYVFLVFGMLGIGAGHGANLAARFAAADLAPAEGRARAIGTLVWASTVGSVVGPTIGFGPAKDLAGSIGFPPLAGPYIVAAFLFAVAALVIQRRLRPDPLVVAGGVGSGGSDGAGLAAAARSLAASPVGRLAVVSMVVGQVVMVAVMTMTPLHMRDGDHALEVIGYVISLHIIGMYACAPVVGWLADRVGARPLLAAGGVLLVVGAELTARTDAADSLGIFLGLFLIGLGWSVGLIAASAMLTSEFDGPERVRVQGLSDLCMTATGGLAGVGSGVVVALGSYEILGHASAVIGVVPTAAVLLMVLSARRSAATRRS